MALEVGERGGERMGNTEGKLARAALVTAEGRYNELQPKRELKLFE